LCRRRQGACTAPRRVAIRDYRRTPPPAKGKLGAAAARVAWVARKEIGAKSDSGFFVSQPRPPEYLSAASRRVWRQVVADYELGAGEPEILSLALVALDRASEARCILEREGITVAGLHSPRAHPCVAIERAASLEFGRLWRQLGLDADEVAGGTARPQVWRAS